MRRIAVALVHYPVLDRAGGVVTTSITNLDIHDIARSAFTFGVERYYLVHPVEAQRELATRVTSHWTEGSGGKRIPDRRLPMEQVSVVSSLAEAKSHWGDDSQVWVTSAKPIEGAMTHRQAHGKLREEGPPVLLILGTGWGLAPEVVDSADASLVPIESPRPDAYNHLSVRAAAAIFFDRLLGGFGA